MHRPELWAFRLVNLVELQRRMSRVQLEIEGRGLDRLLLVAAELSETVGERVGNPEFHLLRRISSVSCGQRDQLANELMDIVVNFVGDHTGCYLLPNELHRGRGGSQLLKK